MNQTASSANLPQLYNRAVLSHQSGNQAEAERLYLQILTIDPSHPGACHMMGILCAQQNRMPEALERMARALTRNPKAVQVLLDRGNVLRALGRDQDALASYEAALAVKPDYTGALSNRGDVLRQIGKLDESLASLDAALQSDSAHVEALNNRGITLCALNRFRDAVADFDRALSLRPGHLASLNNRGFALRNLGRLEDAVASYDQLLALQPQHAEALNNRALALRALGRLNEALEDNGKALAVKPDYAEALDNRALILTDLDRAAEALPYHDKALAIAPGYGEAWYNRANCLRQLKRFDEALESLDRYLTLKPGRAEAWNNRGIVLTELGRGGDALTSYDQALAVRPDFGRALYNRGVALWQLKQYTEATSSYQAALAASPAYAPALGGLAHAALHCCDWDLAAKLAPAIEETIRNGRGDILPFVFLGYSEDDALKRHCAENYAKDHLPRGLKPLWTGHAYRHDKIRVAYMSTDFRRMPMSCCIPELFERHDRSRFEIAGISLGENDRSAERERFSHAVDIFIDARAMLSGEVAKLIRDMEVDILVDLNGYTEGARTEILCYRPAPAQVSYMGYPGTMGTNAIDYIVADEVVVPRDRQHFYREKVLYVPECYWVNDSTRSIGPQLSRPSMGLPEQGFVFCCFNNSWKMTVAIFDIWMRLLRAVPGSVLWLLETNPMARVHLRREAAARGIDSARLVFAKFTEPSMHLGRHGLADLFLDTLPYNAHTTACDALFTGVPVVTLAGQSLAGRVAASLLTAVGLPELVAETANAYENLALDLASDPERLTAIRNKLAENWARAPLFDTDRFRREIERIYENILLRPSGEAQIGSRLS